MTFHDHHRVFLMTNHCPVFSHYRHLLYSALTNHITVSYHIAMCIYSTASISPFNHLIHPLYYYTTRQLSLPGNSQPDDFPQGDLPPDNFPQTIPHPKQFPPRTTATQTTPGNCLCKICQSRNCDSLDFPGGNCPGRTV